MNSLPSTWDLIAPAIMTALGTAGAVVYAGVKYVMIRYIQRTDEMEETLRQLQLQYAVMDVTLRSIKDSLRGHRISINDTTID